jgi:hypothetical protein
MASSHLGIVEGAGDVGLGDDADQVVSVDHGQAANLVLGHRAEDFRWRRPRRW